MRLEALLRDTDVKFVLSLIDTTSALEIWEWFHNLDPSLIVERGGRQLVGSERSWAASPYPKPMALLCVAACLDRELEAALLSRAIYWGKYRRHPPVVKIAIDMLSATLDAPPQARWAVDTVAKGIDELLRVCDFLPSEKVGAVRHLCGLWLADSRKCKFHYAERFLASGSLGVTTPAVEAARTAKAIRDLVPYGTLVAELHRVTRGTIERTGKDAHRNVEDLF